MMNSSLSILGIIAFVLFHVVVTLPLATLTSREIVLPWLRAHGGATDNVSEWVAVTVIFVIMALAFSLRGHVVAASGAQHVHSTRHVHNRHYEYP